MPSHSTFGLFKSEIMDKREKKSVSFNLEMLPEPSAATNPAPVGSAWGCRLPPLPVLQRCTATLARLDSASVSG